ncbi:MAG: serine/threonine protein kinase [Myxococcales bacterium]|nr:MAG: serine/threonine protein kinase [Myxococcales bacterium]
MLGLKPGVRVAGRYELLQPLGEGGMGEVWSALHLITGKRIALKALKADKAARPELVHRFFREARAATAVTHPNVVSVHDVLSYAGAPVMVMELLEGESLAERLRREGRLELPRLAELLVPIVSAVGTAHARGIVHRDLKPENIFLSSSPSGGVIPKVLDFGIAKLTYDDAAGLSALTRTGSMVGTPFYMSPEQAAGEKDFDHRCDVWALGVICFEALSGARPFQGDNFGQVFKRIITEPAPSLKQRRPELPRAVVELVDGMLAKDRAARAALSEVLAVLSQHTDVRAPRFGAPQSELPPEPAAGFTRDSLEAAPALEPVATLADANATAEEPLPESLPPSSPLLETLGATTLGDAVRPRQRRALPLGSLALGAAALLTVASGIWWSLPRPSAAPAREPSPPIAARAATPPPAPFEAPAPTPPASEPPPAASPGKPLASHVPRLLAAPGVAKLREAAPSASALPARGEPEPPKKLPGGILDQDRAPF